MCPEAVWSDTEVSVLPENMKDAEPFRRMDFTLQPFAQSCVLVTPMEAIGVNAELSERQQEALITLHRRFGVEPVPAKE